MLHITNGTSVSIQEAGLGGEVLAWQDVLHEGPVPASLPLRELTRLRARFLDGAWPSASPAVDRLERRDRTLADLAADEVALWFEHDLFDQLQLIQILDWFHARSGRAARLSLICVGEYLGPMSGAQLAQLWPERHTVTTAELELAADAWRAFRSPNPTEIEALLRRGTSDLPFLEGALVRHLQQFPAVENGLSRTQRQILELVEEGHRTFGALFRADQQREERIFMGDTSFAYWIRGLTDCRHPLLESDGEYRLTPTGQDVLRGRADHIRRNGINRWLGGVHLHGSEALWRWSEPERRLVPH